MKKITFLSLLISSSFGCAADTETRETTGLSRTEALANSGCPAPLVRVESESDCAQDAACYRLEAGNEVFYCTGEEPVIPECRGELMRVESPTGCLQDDAVCEETTQGEEAYYCTGPSPLCPEGRHRVQEKTELSISLWDQDGIERFCEPDGAFCDEGLERVGSSSACLQDDALCIRVDAPEGAYYCTGPAPAGNW